METIEIKGREFICKSDWPFTFCVAYEFEGESWEHAYFTDFDNARRFMQEKDAAGALCYCTQAMVMDTHAVLHTDKDAGGIRKA